MSSTQSTTWYSLPTETKLQIVRDLLGKESRVEGSWKNVTDIDWLMPTDRFTYTKTLSIDPLLVDRQLCVLAKDILARQTYLILDLCAPVYTPWPADIFAGTQAFQTLGAATVAVCGLVLPTFASLDLSTFRNNLPQLRNIKIVDVAHLYVQGSLPYIFFGAWFNDLHTLTATDLAELVVDECSQLKSRTLEWLYGSGWGAGNVCGSIDKFRPAQLKNINLYFTGAVGLDISAAHAGTHSVPTNCLYFDMCVGEDGVQVLRVFWTETITPPLNPTMPLLPVLQGLQQVDTTYDADATYLAPTKQESPLRILRLPQRLNPVPRLASHLGEN